MRDGRRNYTCSHQQMGALIPRFYRFYRPSGSGDIDKPVRREYKRECRLLEHGWNVLHVFRISQGGNIAYVERMTYWPALEPVTLVYPLWGWARIEISLF